MTDNKTDLEIFIEQLRADFYGGLAIKTGWGRTEVKNLFEQILSRILLRVAAGTLRLYTSALLFLLLLVPAARSADLSMGMSAALTSWNTSFNPLQTPGWTLPVHPGGVLDLQWGHLYGEVGGDPHRPREATSVDVGLRGDLFRYKRLAVYGQVSAGVFMAPSFLEYCGSYEYKNGDCGAGSHEPEYCWWANVNVGFGARVRVTNGFSLEPARFEYVQMYALSPRWRFSSGFRVFFTRRQR